MSGYIAAYIVLICLSAFFSASEMCFSSANRMRLESAAEGGSRGEGDSFRYEDLEVTVLAMDGLRVDRVLVKRSGPEPGETEEN